MQRGLLNARALGRQARLDARVRALAGFLYALEAAYRATRGEDAAAELLDAAAIDAGRRVGTRLASEFAVSGRNAISSAAPGLIALETYEAEYEIVVARSRELEMRVVRCPLREAARAEGPEAEAACCRDCGGRLEGMVQAVNDEATFEMPDKMGHGAKRCLLRVATRKREPGPDGLDVPNTVRYMPATTRKRWVADALSETITHIIKRAAESDLSHIDIARALGHATYASGLRTGAYYRELFGVKTASLDDAVTTARLIAEVNGAGTDADRDGDAITWRVSSCLFAATGEIDAGESAAGFACGACRDHHEGMLAAGDPTIHVDLEASVLAGDGHCAFRARRLPLRERLRRRGAGDIVSGHDRVALLPPAMLAGLGQLLGPTLEHVGRRVGAELVRHELRAGLALKDERSLNDIILSVGRLGFGQLTVRDGDLEEPLVIVECLDSFEADAALRDAADAPKVGTCHLVRGLVAGLVEEMSGTKGLTAEETRCRALGDDDCEFVVTR